MEEKDKGNEFSASGSFTPSAGFLMLLIPTLPSAARFAEALRLVDPAFIAEARKEIEEAIQSGMLSTGMFSGTDYAAFFTEVFKAYDQIEGGTP